MNRFQAVVQEARRTIARHAHRPAIQGAAALVAALLALGVIFPQQFTFIVIGAVLGVGAAGWPTFRRRLRAEKASPALRRDAAIEGVAAGSFKVAAGLATISITSIVADLGSTKGAVDVAIAFTSVVAAVVTYWRIRRLRANPEQPPSSASVLWSFLLVAIGLGGVALSPNVWWLGASLALIGLPVATNARFRYAAMARHSNQEGSFQRISNRWNRGASVGGLVLAGWASALTPLGWRGTAAVAAGCFVALGAFVHVARTAPAGSWRARVQAPNAAQRPFDPDDLKLRSVWRQRVLIVFVVGTAQLARTSLEPVLAAGGLGSTSSLFAAIIAGTAQLAMIPVIDRFAEGSNRSPRQMAFRAAVWFLPAAVIAALAAATPWWWLTLPLAACWFVFTEASSGGVSSATRVGLNRSGQIASLYGLLSGYGGSALGAVVAGLPATRHPLWLGVLLLVGALIAFGISLWTPRQTPTNRKQIQTRGIDLEITIERRSEREFTATVRDEHGRGGVMELGDGDRLSSRRPCNDQRAAERQRVLDVSTWAGEAWWPCRWQALWAGTSGVLKDLWPQDSAGFVSRAFHGSVRWHGSAELPFDIQDAEQGVVIHLRLPRPWRVTWYLEKWLDQSELVRLVE